jgi:hypothetical protein
MKKITKRNYKKRNHNKPKFSSKTNRKTRRGGKGSIYKPIPLPDVPSSIDNTIQDIMDESSSLTYYGGKSRSKSKRYHKGGFKIDSVDNIEDRDDDWLITKQ